MRPSRICPHCGHDTARVRAERHAPTGLSVVACPSCSRVAYPRKAKVPDPLRPFDDSVSAHMRAMLFMMAAVMFGVAFFAVTAQVTSDARSPDFDFIETTALVSMAWYAAIGAVIGMLASVWLAIACGHWRTPRLAWAMAVVLSGVMLIGWLTAPGVRGLSLDRLFDSPGNELRRWRPPPFWLNSVTFVTSFTLITLGLRAMLLNAARRPRFRRRMLRRLVLQQSPWRRVRG